MLYQVRLKNPPPPPAPGPGQVHCHEDICSPLPLEPFSALHIPSSFHWIVCGVRGVEDHRIVPSNSKGGEGGACPPWAPCHLPGPFIWQPHSVYFNAQHQTLRRQDECEPLICDVSGRWGLCSTHWTSSCQHGKMAWLRHGPASAAHNPLGMLARDHHLEHNLANSLADTSLNAVGSCLHEQPC